MQKLFIVLVLFCILQFNAEFVCTCKPSKCQAECKKQKKNGRCSLGTVGTAMVNHRCRCY
uniref:Potassium channel blocker Tx1 n=1 Tax=Androctonus bicolor TaxID=748906 RepID=A0A0A6ZIM7_9SCOR|nr:potassium channel blocker Tx1 precursor [Androctonus bicolor]AGV98851.1 potassium channel blocker Tx1 precursor [Androctonus bicolor]